MTEKSGGIASDTILNLYIDPAKLVGTPLGQQWIAELKLLPGWHEPLPTPRISSWTRLPLVIRVAIGDLPQVGLPIKHGRKCKCFPVPSGIGIAAFSFVQAAQAISQITQIITTEDVDSFSIGAGHNRTICIGGTSLRSFSATTGQLVSCNPADCIGQLLPVCHTEPILGNNYCRELGYLYGALASDGWFRDSMIGYAKLDPDKRAEVVRILQQHIGKGFSVNEYHDDGTSPGKFAPSAKIHIFSRPVRELLADCYCQRGAGRGALYKKLPDAFFSYASRETLLGLLAGILEGDSSLIWSHAKQRPQAVCRSHTSSLCMVVSLERLARLLGIRTSVTVTPPRHNSNESYTVLWSLADMIRVIPEVAFVGQEELRWKKQFLEQPPSKDHTDIVPVKTSMANELSRMFYQNGDMKLFDRCNYAKKSATFTRHVAKQVNSSVDSQTQQPEEWEQFQKMVDAQGIHWSKVQVADFEERQNLFGLALDGPQLFATHSGFYVAAV
jgi:hypothetical protein